jgi:hypothetical protein
VPRASSQRVRRVAIHTARSTVVGGALVGSSDGRRPTGGMGRKDVEGPGGEQPAAALAWCSRSMLHMRRSYADGSAGMCRCAAACRAATRVHLVAEAGRR